MYDSKKPAGKRAFLKLERGASRLLCKHIIAETAATVKHMLIFETLHPTKKEQRYAKVRADFQR